MKYMKTNIAYIPIAEARGLRSKMINLEELRGGGNPPSSTSMVRMNHLSTSLLILLNI